MRRKLWRALSIDALEQPRAHPAPAGAGKIRKMRHNNKLGWFARPCWPGAALGIEMAATFRREAVAFAPTAEDTSICST
jgi:hypothetical protein